MKSYSEEKVSEKLLELQNKLYNSQEKDALKKIYNSKWNIKLLKWLYIKNNLQLQ